jgi:hypothetical protein
MPITTCNSEKPCHLAAYSATKSSGNSTVPTNGSTAGANLVTHPEASDPFTFIGDDNKNMLLPVMENLKRRLVSLECPRY